ncbi:ferredoxin 1b isoform X2 [Rhinoraja longicauda]
MPNPLSLSYYVSLFALQTSHGGKDPQSNRPEQQQQTLSDVSRSDDKLIVHFITRYNEKLTAVAKEGDSLLDVVTHHNLNIDGFGACEGTLACSTCHIIFDKETFQTLDTITDEELDMLDLAFGLTSTSRLGCQICLKKSLDGITVKIPKDVSDVRKAADAKEQL